MASLTGNTIQSTYDSLLKVTDNDSITGSLKRITDGLGNNTPLYLSSSAVEIVSTLNVTSTITASNLSGTNTGDETKSSIETKLGAATSSNSGYLTSTDWSTFNNKIAGTGTLNTIPKFTSSSSIGNSSISDNGTIVTINEDVNISGGSLGIGTSSLTGINLHINKTITGATTGYGIALQGAIQSDVTGNARLIWTNPSTQATTFTLGQLVHYYANQGTFGAGSTVTTQTGFLAEGTLIGATNNYGFRGIIPSGTNRWNLYMDGTANNYLAGNLGIGSVSLTQYNLRLERSITGNATSFSFYNAGIVQSDVTTTANYNATYTNTQAASFTLAGMNHYNAIQGVFGAGSAVTTQSAFRADSSLIGATNNYGFRGLIPSGTGRWNLYMDGTANNYLAGALGIGSTSLTGVNLAIGRNLTGAVTVRGINQSYTILSDVTNNALINSTSPSTAAATFTLPAINHYHASQGTFGAGSTVTNQFGFQADSTLIGATNNYGFRGNIPSGTGRWNLYMDGTANNHMAGSLGIGATALTGYSLRVSKTLTGGSNTVGINSDGVVQSDSTSSSAYFSTLASTQAASFTLGALVHYNSSQSTIGAGSAVTTQTGFLVNSNLTGATTNYGFRGLIPSGTNRWNLYMDGTANNYLAGNLGIGITSPSYKLSVWQGEIAISNLDSSFTAPMGGIATFNDNANTGGLIFKTNSSGTFAERMRITSGGSVLTGTTTATYSGATFRSVIAAADTRVMAFNGTTNSSVWWLGSGSPQFAIDSISGGGATFWTNSGSWSERMRLNSSGRLLINKTADDVTGATVQVSGNISFTNSFNTQISNYTLVLGDQCRIIQTDNASANTVTVPTDASVNFPVGTEIAVIQYGTGQTTIVASSGVTIRSRNSYTKIADRYTGATLVKLGVNDWYLIGNLTA